MQVALRRRLMAEAMGTAFLLATVVGSGIMGERLAGGNEALALLGNTLPTGAILVVLILVFGPSSGAHFNPVVSIASGLDGSLCWRDVVLYIAIQVVGAVIGVLIAHAMFDLPILQTSVKSRNGIGQWLAEFIATFGLMLTIFGTRGEARAVTAAAVGLYITAAYWFTASTSFANPAVTLARSLTDTFSGIAPTDVAAFIAAQMLGMCLALFFWRTSRSP